MQEVAGGAGDGGERRVRGREKGRDGRRVRAIWGGGKQEEGSAARGSATTKRPGNAGKRLKQEGQKEHGRPGSGSRCMPCCRERSQGEKRTKNGTVS